jgi:hypothetical protein
MEAATSESAPAVSYTVEQVRAQQNDRPGIFRRAVQNLHVQIIEVTDEHARTGDEACEALEKLPTRDVDRAQSAPQKAHMRIFVPAQALTSILTTRSTAASAPSRCELARASATWRCWLLGCPYPTSMRAAYLQQACGIYIQAAHRRLCW